MAYNKELAGKILNQLYHFRLWRIKRTEWRRRLAKLNVKVWKFSTEEFCDTWNFLHEKRLI